MNCIQMNINAGHTPVRHGSSSYAQLCVGKIVVAVLTSQACQEGCYVC